MKKSLLLSIVFCAIISGSHVQAHNWQWGVYANGYNLPLGLSATAAGSVYMAGGALGAMLFGNDTLQNINYDNLFVAQYNAQGGVNWVRGATGAAVYSPQFASVDIQSVSCDADGNVFAAGNFSDYIWLAFGNDTLYEDSGFAENILVKYDVNGNFQWAKTPGGHPANYQPARVAASPYGNAYVTGSVPDSTMIFGTDTTTGAPGYFLVKYDAGGQVKWVRRWTSSAASTALGSQICTDALGNIYVSGSFTGTVAFGNDTLTNSSLGSIHSSLFIVKYDSSGNVLWAKSPKGDGALADSPLTADGQGNCYLTGSGQSPLIFDADTLTAGTAGGTVPFIVKLDATGNTQWLKNLSASMNAIPLGITVDAAGAPYVAGGYFGDSAFFVNDTLHGPDNKNAFLIKYDTSGQEYWVTAPTGYNGYHQVGYPLNQFFGVAADAVGNVYVSGDFTDSLITFGADTVLEMSYPGSVAYFVAKIGQCAAVNAVISKSGNDTLSTGSFTSYQWLNNGAPISNATQQSYIATAPGLYQVVVNAAGGCPDTSAVYSFTTGIENNGSSFNNMRIYPNPANGSFILETQGALGNEFAVYDLPGNTVLSQTIESDKQTIALPNVAPGIYFLAMQVNGIVHTSKLVIMKE